MWVDTERFKTFYRTKLGALVQRTVLKSVAELWPSTKGDVIGGYGYCHPYLNLFDGEAERILSLMPAPQGGCPWPPGKKNLSTLVEESLWPLADQSLDRLMVCHALEYSDDLKGILDECWRVLVDGGELLVIVPNRRGPWAQVTKTPLGYGTPYTGFQLYEVLSHHGFTPLKPKYCLYAPPSEKLLSLKLAPTFEKYGAYFSKKLAGVLLFPAKKEIFALAPRRKTVTWAPPRVFKPTVS
jgi:SAM-dependent methyltransferase